MPLSGTASLLISLFQSTSDIQRDRILDEAPELGNMHQSHSTNRVPVGDDDIPLSLGDTSTYPVKFVVIMTNHNVLLKVNSTTPATDPELFSLKSGGIFVLFNTNITSIHATSDSTCLATINVFYGTDRLDD